MSNIPRGRIRTCPNCGKTSAQVRILAVLNGRKPGYDWGTCQCYGCDCIWDEYAYKDGRIQNAPHYLGDWGGFPDERL